MKFRLETLSETDRLAGYTHRWEAIRKVDGFDIFAGRVEIRNHEVRFRFAGELGVIDMAEITAFMQEAAGQYRADRNAAQIERELNPQPQTSTNGVSHDDADSHSRFDRFGGILCGGVVAHVPNSGSDDQADRVVG